MNVANIQAQVKVGTTFKLFETEFKVFTNQYVSNAIEVKLRKAALDSIVEYKPEHFNLLLPIPGQGIISVNATKRSIAAPGFEVLTSDGVQRQADNFLDGMVHYAGEYGGAKKKNVALSFFENWMMGVVMDKSGNYDIGQITGGAPDEYVIYLSNELAPYLSFECKTMEPPLGFQTDNTNSPDWNCSRTFTSYLECDFKTYQDRGSNVSNTVNFATGIYNVTAIILENENLNTTISTVFVWTSSDPFAGSTDASTILNNFKNTRTTFTGDFAHLLSTRPLNNGGIAFIDAVCVKSFAYAYSNIENSFASFPTYSWSVNVVTHELGHNLGSPHTHSCSWPGGPIDNCFPVEGTCADGPAPPPTGGTIMSYCHLTPAGVNFNAGFGTLPGNLIRTRVQNGACLAILPGSDILAIGCIPSTSNPNNNTNAGPVRVILNTIDHSSPGSLEGHFTDFTCAQGTVLNKGATYTISVNTELNPQNVRAFIDYNGNNIFEESERILLSNGTLANQTHSASFTVPNTSLNNTNVRMRVVSDFITNSNPLPCGNLNIGQAEDYRIYLMSETTPLQPGVLAAGNQTLCNPANPAVINFATQPSGGDSITFQWYFQNGIVDAPSENAPITGWTIIAGAESNSYNPPAGLTVSRTYACRVSNGETSKWAIGVRQITVLPAVIYGSLAAGNQTFVSGGVAATIEFATAPSGGSGEFNIQWFLRDGIHSAPVGNSTDGWTPIPNANASTYSPGLVTASTSFAAFVSPSGVPVCGEGAWASGVRQITVNAPQPNIPIITPATGTYTDPLLVTISSTTPGAEIYYTTNGNNPRFDVPNNFTKLYTGPFTILQNTTIRAVSKMPDGPPSGVARSIITITNPGIAAAPVVTPGSGVYNALQNVNITTQTPDAVIHYTTNGMVPVPGTSFTRVFTTPFTVGTKTTIRAMAVKPGILNSPITVAVIDFETPLVAAPVVFDPPAGSYPGAISLSLSSTTPNAMIYYTTNGNSPRLDIPNLFTKLYSTPLNIASNTTVRAIAVADGFLNSPVSLGIYSITGGGRFAFDELAPANADEEVHVNVYPNPNSGHFNLAIDNPQQDLLKIQLVDPMGRIACSLQRNEPAIKELISVPKLPPGVYSLMVYGAQQKYIRRIIIQ
jgi:hypothetical protein